MVTLLQAGFLLDTWGFVRTDQPGTLGASAVSTLIMTVCGLVGAATVDRHHVFGFYEGSLVKAAATCEQLHLVAGLHL